MWIFNFSVFQLWHKTMKVTFFCQRKKKSSFCVLCKTKDYKRDIPDKVATPPPPCNVRGVMTSPSLETCSVLKHNNNDDDDLFMRGLIRHVTSWRTMSPCSRALEIQNPTRLRNGRHFGSSTHQCARARCCFWPQSRATMAEFGAAVHSNLPL